MNFRIILAMVILVMSGCKSNPQLSPVSQIKPSVSQEGTLANQKLIADTKAGIDKILGQDDVTTNTKVIMFVIQQPVGEPGSRSWREMWTVEPEKSQKRFLITFTEAGLGAADFKIKPMNNKQANENCPSNITKFVVEVATSENIKHCMGKPIHEDYNPDGRFLYMYKAKNGVIITYLFGKDKKLIKVSGFQKDA